jgi:hypothetical protein
MANPRRGEIEAVIDGRRRTLCLTLGALAALEAAFGVDDMVALAERFASGRPSARDLMRVIAAGLDGAGAPIDEAAAGRMMIEGGALGAAEIVGRLFAATFGLDPAGAADAATGGEGDPAARPPQPGRAGGLSRSPGRR